MLIVDTHRLLNPLTLVRLVNAVSFKRVRLLVDLFCALAASCAALVRGSLEDTPSTPTTPASAIIDTIHLMVVQLNPEIFNT